MNDMRMLNFNKDINILSDEFKNFYKQDMIVPIIGSGFTLNEKNKKGNSVSSGQDMKQHMIKKIVEADNRYPKDELINESFSSVSSIYDSCVSLEERKRYVSNMFTDVILDTEKKDFINLPFKTMYTLNIDDAIENNNRNIEIVVSNKDFLDENILNDFRKNGKTILFKMHGDAKSFLKHNDQLIFSKEEYVASIVKNTNILNQLSTDIISNCVLFIGCSLEDEIDLVYSASSDKYGNTNLKHTYFVTHKKLNLIQQNKLTKYNIDTVIQLNGTDTYPEFYAFLTEVYYKAIKEKAQDSLNNLSPIVISVPSSQNTIEQDFKFLVNSNECFKKLSSHNEILTPSFFITRNIFKKSSALDCFLKNDINILYGHRFSGKTYCMIDLYRRLSTEIRVFFPPTVEPDVESLISFIKSKTNTIIFIDSNSIEDELLDFIFNNQMFLKNNKIRLVFSLTSADKENLYVLKKIKDITQDKNLLVGSHYIDNRLSKNETELINNKLASSLMGNFSYSDQKRETILDNIFSLLSSHKLSISYDLDITNRKVDGELLNVNTIEILIILAIQNSRMTVKDIEKFYLSNAVGNVEKKFNPIIQFDYINIFEKNIYDTSSQKLICNSKVWLLYELQRLSRSSRNIDLITKAYQNIIKAINNIYKNNPKLARNKISRYIKFDEINDIFSDSKGARQLINSIYDGLFGLLSDNFQYFHQRAKSLSWQDRDIDSLKSGLDFVNKARHNVEVQYKHHEYYLEMESYKHICYTRATILTKIARYHDYKDYDCNNRAILGIKDALIFDSNLNYLEEDNKRGEPNSLVTFIKK
ncbi:SIR2 family protein [Enterococcus faecalis]|uniref:SIR2 family protein n=3 Tax=Enterococcus TaxID=1350 RepID=UPI0025B22787|nr:SIR2 family protein [Enterococcus faecalis]MDN3101189.1 SIR2 family protein [Enterococcus faecalis]MDN3103975.1 SIR2 family protein [Enterococcus faecalis]